MKNAETKKIKLKIDTCLSELKDLERYSGCSKISYSIYKSLCIHVEVPFELKDIFKSVFKDAKWSNDLDCWYILNSEENITKLNTLIRELDDYLKSNIVINIESAEQINERIKDLIHDFFSSQLKFKHAKIKYNNIVNNLSEILSKIDFEKAEIIEHEYEESKKNAYAKMHEIFDKCAIDINLLKNKMNEMHKFHSKVGSQAKEKFDESQSYIILQSKKLKEIGLLNKAINFAKDANFNRFERDRVDQITDEDWLIFSELN